MRILPINHTKLDIDGIANEFINQFFSLVIHVLNYISITKQTMIWFIFIYVLRK